MVRPLYDNYGEKVIPVLEILRDGQGDCQIIGRLAFVSRLVKRWYFLYSIPVLDEKSY